MGKLVEKIVASRLLFDAGKYNLLPSTQFGGRPHSSCLDAGLSLVHDIETARKRGLLSTLLTIDIKGFFDHVQHARLVWVLWNMGFSQEICTWVLSFLTDREATLCVDDRLSDFFPINVGVPQGSPVSPVLACLYAAEPLRILTNNPAFSGTGLPIGPRSYVDDLAFLAISDSPDENIIMLRHTLYTAISLFAKIGMEIDPDKSELIHFTWKKKPRHPTLTFSHRNKKITLTPAPTLRWLGFHLDSRLSFREHVKIMAKKGNGVIHGLSCLGNTIHGMNQYHLRLLFKTCVIPVLTYGSQLWFNPEKPPNHLIKTLQKVQNNALRRVAGAFRTSPIEALQLLTHIPPIHITIRKISESAALRVFRLPLSSEVSHRLPSTFIPVSIPRPVHVPFERPLLRYHTFSHLTHMVRWSAPDTERSDPFHSHCAPYAFQLSSPPFHGRLRIRHDPCVKDKKLGRTIRHENLFQEYKEDLKSIFVVTDGSRRNKRAGYSVVVWHAGKIITKVMVPFAQEASAFDAEMYALAHASSLIRKILTLNYDINEVYLLSDCSSALQVIFDPSPHPSQAASIMFRTNIHAIMTARSDVFIDLEWTPGHGGTHMMKVADLAAKNAANPKSKRAPLLSFTSKSSAVQDINTAPRTRWRLHLDNPNHEIPETSGFYPASQYIRPALRPTHHPHFKDLDRATFSRFVQCATNHGYIGEYFSKFVPSRRSSNSCSCVLSSDQPLLQTRDHVLRSCVQFERAREHLEKVCPSLHHPTFSLARLFSPSAIPALVSFLKESAAFSKSHSPPLQEDEWMPPPQDETVFNRRPSQPKDPTPSG